MNMNRSADDTIMDELEHRPEQLESLQYINEDMAKIIIDFLKLSMQGLIALSQSCRIWYSRINSLLDNRFRHFIPLTYSKHSKMERNKALSTLFENENLIGDIQAFEYEQIDISSFGGINLVPWNKNIMVILSDSAFSICDLRKSSALPFTKPEVYREFFRLISFNADNPDAETDIQEGLEVYSIDDDGLVEHTCSIISKSCNQIHDRMWVIPPKLYISNDGIIWMSTNDAIHRYSIDGKEWLPDLDVDLGTKGVIGMTEFDGAVQLLCTKVENTEFDSVVYSYNTKTRLMNVFLPSKIGALVEPDVLIKDNFIHIMEYREQISAVYQREPLKLVYAPPNLSNSCHVSPDGSKFFCVVSKVLTVYETKKGIINAEFSNYTNFSLVLVASSHYQYKWLTNNIIICLATETSSFAILDLRKTKSGTLVPKFIKLPLGLKLKGYMVVLDENSFVLCCRKGLKTIFFRISLAS